MIEHDMTFECNMCEWKMDIDKGIWKEGTEEEVFEFLASKISGHSEEIHSLPLHIYLPENIIHDYDMSLVSDYEEAFDESFDEAMNESSDKDGSEIVNMEEVDGNG